MCLITSYGRQRGKKRKEKMVGGGGVEPAWDLSIQNPMLYHGTPYLTNMSDIS